MTYSGVRQHWTRAPANRGKHHIITRHAYPWNVDTARLVERDVRDTRATPCTIAVIDGAAHRAGRGR
jgi:hypothetical protein